MEITFLPHIFKYEMINFKYRMIKSDSMKNDSITCRSMNSRDTTTTTTTTTLSGLWVK